MPHSPVRKPINLTLDSDLLSDAKALNVNLSRAAEDGVRAAVIRAREEQWRAENAAALASSNTFVNKHGLPLDRYRQF
ncbi:type II toxin-antitoxin system CcdA family antitoxin [uncultured Roseobacter sp.]|uniref:type II toxin-antitoxin system CcdA family antitoxin n=1 Tax=uncultured Roseobacter sp. TaxID=114847 RepID=UPI00262C51D8|nr:type II toxin-antitoxin system CcdA family antitoxin [uncultured Roseobacter sp.]